MIKTKFNGKVLIFSLLNFIHISCLMVVLERGKEYCINKDIDSGDTLRFSFMVSGEKEDSIDIKIHENDFKLIYSNKESERGYKDYDDFSYDIIFKSKILFSIFLFFKFRHF